MAETPSQLPRTLWVGIIFLFGFLCLAVLLALAELKKQQLPPPVYGQVADFTLTNENGQATSLADLTNHVWVADIIFTRCAGPCPQMTAQMSSIASALARDSNARFVTVTTDPDYDSPEMLKRYGQRFGADFNHWIFLTGAKSEVAALAANSLKLGSTTVAPSNQKDAADLFIHSTIFVAVDKHARLRGIFETGGEDVDWTNVIRPKLLTTIRELEHES
jgi:protein SCO1/2